MSIVGYGLVTGADFAKVEARVNELIAVGWQPFGPPLLRPQRKERSVGDPTETNLMADQLVQAMVQYEYQEAPEEP